MSESVNEELNRIKSNIVNTYSTLSDVGLISEGNTNSDNLANTVKNLSWGGGELCDIGLALFIDESAGMRRLLNGQILNIEPKYKPFLSKLQLIATAYPNILCTEAEWQAIKESSPFGQVGKFVLNYDEAGENVISVRLPAVVNLQGLQDLQYLGDKLEEALPNITGHTGNPKTLTNTQEIGTPEGVFYIHSQTSNDFGHTSTGASGRWSLGFDASRSSSIYKNNAHVQQEAIQYPYYIQVNLTEYNHMIDVGQIQEIADRIYVKGTWSDGTSGYRYWSDGYCEQWSHTPEDSGNVICNLFLAYRDTDYIVMTEQVNTDNNAEGEYGAFSTNNKTNSSFQITRYSSMGYFWKASGYLAEGAY